VPETPLRLPKAIRARRSLRCSALLAVAITLAGPALWHDTTGLVAGLYAHDDCFYYFQIARNVVEGHGFTFDGRHPTNGFHPLWLFALTPLFALVPGDLAPLRAVALLETGLVLGAGVLIFRVLRRRVGEQSALLAALLLVAPPGSLRVVRSGMESSLLLLLLVLTWGAYLTWRESAGPATGRALVMGILAAFCFACRLEAGLALVAICLLDRRRLWRFPREAFAAIAPMLAGGAVLAAWYGIAFGILVPVSGLVKAHWAAQGDALQQWTDWLRVPWFGELIFQRLFGTFFLRESPAAALIYGALMAGLAALALKERAQLAGAIRRGGLGFPLLAAALMLLTDKLVLRHMEVWHQVPLLLATALLAGTLLADFPRMTRLATLLALAAVVGRLPPALQADGSATSVRYVLDAAHWLRTNTPEDVRAASWNGGGMLGYFSHRSVVVLDGFANDAAYLRDVIRGGRLEEYLLRERIAWIGEPACGARPDLAPIVARNARERPGMPVPADAQARVASARLTVAFYREESPDGCPGFALWRTASR